MKLQEVLHIAMEAGEILLRNGAETYRIEESITKICHSYGHSCETFVLPTGFFLTVRSQDEQSETVVRRIKVRTLNLAKIDRVNTFSRKLADHPLPLKDAVKELDDIKSTEDYPSLVMFFCTVAVAFAYALLFGGNWAECLICCGIGTISYFFNVRMTKSGYFPFLIYFVMGFIGGFFSMLSLLILPGGNVYIIVISSVLLYLPGVAMTNGVRDLLAGDIVSGLTRLGEAVLTVLALGMGVGLAISISAMLGL